MSIKSYNKSSERRWQKKTFKMELSQLWVFLMSVIVWMANKPTSRRALQQTDPLSAILWQYFLQKLDRKQLNTIFVTRWYTLRNLNWDREDGEDGLSSICSLRVYP